MHLGDAQKGSTEDADDQRCEHGERSFPVILRVGPFVLAEAIEGSNQTSTDDQAEEQAEGCAIPDLGRSEVGTGHGEGESYLLDELAIDSGISLRTIKSLLQESEEDGNNYGSLEGLSKDDEEDWDSEDVDSHDEVLTLQEAVR